MAKIGDLKRINKEDFAQKDQDLVNRLGFALNPFLERIAVAFNKGIDFNNLNQDLSTFNVKVDGAGNPVVKTSVRYGLKTRLNGITVISAKNTTDETPVISTPFITYTLEGTSLKITNITGLPADKNFTITMILIG